MRSKRLRLLFIGSGGNGATVDVGGGIVDGDALALLILLFSFEHGQAILQFVAVGPAGPLTQRDDEGAIGGIERSLVAGLHGVEQPAANRFQFIAELLHLQAELTERFNVRLSLGEDSVGAGAGLGYDATIDLRETGDGPFVAGGSSHGDGVVCVAVEGLIPPCCSNADRED